MPQEQVQGLDKDHSNDRPILIAQVRQLRAADAAVSTESASWTRKAVEVCLTNKFNPLKTSKQVQAGTGIRILMGSEELRKQRMPSPNKLHHFRRPEETPCLFAMGGDA
jgi:hypothetical protein